MARGLKKKIQSVASTLGEAEVVPLNPVDNAPQTVGELLRSKREEFGIDLRETADFLRIRYGYLLAIEEGRVDDLPGATYAMGFVRAYADHLGLDGPAIVERYKDETAELGDDVRLVFPSPQPEGKVPSGAILLISVVALGLVYGGWAVFAQKDSKIADLVPALPESFRAFLGSEDETSTSEEAASVAQSTPGEPAAPDPNGAVERNVNSAAEAQVSGKLESATAPLETATNEARPEQAANEGDRQQTEGTVDGLQKTLNGTVAAVGERAVAANAARESDAPDQSAATIDRELPPSAIPTKIETTSLPAQPAESSTASVVEEVQTEAVAGSPAESSETSNAETQTADTQTADTGSARVETERAVAETVQPVESSASGVMEAAESVQVAEAAQTGDASSAAANQLPTQVAQSDTPALQTVAALPPKPPASGSTEPRQYGVENADSRVLIRARIDSWVEIKDRAGDTLLTRVLRTGDSYRVPDQPGLLMLTGNAGGLEITVDGSSIPDLGPKGAVRRDVLLDADSLKATVR